MPLAHICLAILVAAIYGTAFVAIQIAVNEIPPLMATGYRYLLTALPLLFFIKKPDVPWLILAAYGVSQGVIMFGLIFTAIKLGMPGGLASLVVQAQVFFTIGFALLVFGERPNVQQLFGAFVAFCGIGVIALGLRASAPLIPFFMTLASAAIWGVANIISKTAKPNSMLGFVVWSAAFAPLPLFALSSIFEGTGFGVFPIFPPSPKAIGALLYLAYPTTVFGFSAWVFLLQRHNAAIVTPFALLVPIFGMASMALVFGERFTEMTAFGSVLVFIGLLVAVLPRHKLAQLSR
ncbi:MAG: EamA family transporter [Ahrensia sp.]|nr:EamA family transporter [Ahrensia sp.]